MNITQIQSWIDSSPDAVRVWLQSLPFRVFAHERRNEAFQMIGRYDGAMSEDCKAIFRSEYEMLDTLVRALEGTPNAQN